MDISRQGLRGLSDDDLAAWHITTQRHDRLVREVEQLREQLRSAETRVGGTTQEAITVDEGVTVRGCFGATPRLYVDAYPHTVILRVRDPDHCDQWLDVSMTPAALIEYAQRCLVLRDEIDRALLTVLETVRLALET